MCRISPRFDLASGAKSNLGKIRGLRQARGRISGKCGARVGCEVESRGNAGPRVGREVESWRNTAL